MGLQLNTVIPWGRNFNEYMRMFDLTSDNLKQSILDCAGGPASFNIEMIKQGYSIISCDPIYQFSADEIYRRIQETYTTVIDGVKANYQDYVWDHISSPEQLGEIRMAAMKQFLADFPIRIFPLLKVSGEPSPFLQPIIQELETKGYLTTIKTVNYEFQKNGNQMLKIKKSP